jgi:predicted DNA-binding antitoxin AbrB/MazE fold protein
MTQADPNAPAEKAAAAKKRTAKPKAAAVSEVLVPADAEELQEPPQAEAELQAADPAPATAEQLEKADEAFEKDSTDSEPSLSSAETELLAENQKSESVDLPEKDEVVPTPESVALEPSAALQVPSDEAENTDSGPSSTNEDVVPVLESVALEPSAALQDPSDKAESKAYATSKQTRASSQHRIYVTVKNMGMQAVFEPLSKTSIKPGESVEIGCKSNQFKSEVVNNLQQFIGLGKRLEIKNA